MHGPVLHRSGAVAMPAFRKSFTRLQARSIPSRDGRHWRRCIILQAPPTLGKPTSLSRVTATMCGSWWKANVWNSACRARQEDPRMAPTRSLLLERLFQEARRYHEKANVIDHVEDRMRFIASGQVELPRPQGRLNIGVAAEAARRVELAAQYIGAQGRGFTARTASIGDERFVGSQDARECENHYWEGAVMDAVWRSPKNLRSRFGRP